MFNDNAGSLVFSAGIHELPRAVLTHASGAEVEIYLHGAHITSWRASTGEELFFVSREALFAADRPIRGGIPVIFPQFGPGPLPAHGFARVTPWSVAHCEVCPESDISLTLRLTQTPATLASWPHRFRLELTARLRERALAVTLRVVNTDEQPFTFQTALHTYFTVTDIQRAVLRGLRDISYLDSLREDAREVETRPDIRFAAETDRIYVDAPDALQLEDEASERSLQITKAGLPDVVVWNPWIDKARRLSDFADDEYQHMLCVETGLIVTPYILAAGEEWEGTTVFEV